MLAYSRPRVAPPAQQKKKGSIRHDPTALSRLLRRVREPKTAAPVYPVALHWTALSTPIAPPRCVSTGGFRPRARRRLESARSVLTSRNLPLVWGGEDHLPPTQPVGSTAPSVPTPMDKMPRCTAEDVQTAQFFTPGGATANHRQPGCSGGPVPYLRASQPCSRTKGSRNWSARASCNVRRPGEAGDASEFRASSRAIPTSPRCDRGRPFVREAFETSSDHAFVRRRVACATA